MLIRLTKSNHSLQLGLLILLAIALWLPNFLNLSPIEIDESQSFLYRSWFGWTNSYVLLAKILAFLCVFLQAFFLNELVKLHSVSKNSIFIALIYSVLMGVCGDWQTMHPFLISNFFIIGGYWYLFKIYDQKEPYGYVFNAAAMFALASLFSASLLPFALIVFWIFLFYPINKWREWVIAILGFGLPFFAVYLWASITDNLVIFSEFAISLKHLEILGKIADLSLMLKLFLVFVLALTLMGIGFMQLRAKYSEISQRKKITALQLGAIWMIIMSLFTAYSAANMATLFVFSAFFLAEWLYRSERAIVSESVFYVFLTMVFLVQYL